MGKKGASTVQLICLVLLLVLTAHTDLFAHGIAGKRFFPTTFMVDDPFVSDEFSLLGNYRNFGPNESGQDVISTSLSAEYSKRITPKLGVIIGGQYEHLRTQGDGSVSGFGNLEVTAKYQFHTSEEHETLFSFGVSDEIGGTGNGKIADDFSVVSPAFYFGKGFGDIADGASLLRPIAVTGLIGANFPTRSETIVVNDRTGETAVSRNPTTLAWAFSVQYSLMYLQSFVKDIGLGTPWDRMIVVIEFPLETCLNRGCSGETTGTVNPGFVWIGKRIELGLSAQVPINDRSGKRVGGIGLVHVFLDDLFPRSLGRPVWERKK